LTSLNKRGGIKLLLPSTKCEIGAFPLKFERERPSKKGKKAKNQNKGQIRRGLAFPEEEETAKVKKVRPKSKLLTKILVCCLIIYIINYYQFCVGSTIALALCILLLALRLKN